MIERHAIESRQQWLDLRRVDITASRVAAVNGTHPYLTPLKLHMMLRGVEFPDPDDKVLRRGRWLERAVAEAVAEMRPDWTLEKCDSYFRNPKLRIGATPDYLATRGPAERGVIQIKTTAPSVFDREWLKGTQVPAWIVSQTLLEEMLTGSYWGAVAVMVVDPFDLDVHIIEVPRNPDREAQLLEQVAAFWADVDAGREPEPDYGKDADLVKVIAPHERSRDTAIDLSGRNYLPAQLDRRAQLMQQIAADEAEKKSIETELKFAMGDAAVATGIDGWRITYRAEAHKEHVVPASNPRVLRIYNKRESPA